MTTYTGNSGVVTLSGTAIGEVSKFNFSWDAPPLEDTKLTATNRTFKTGIPQVGGSIECWADPGDTPQNSMFTALNAGTTVTLVLRPIGTGSGRVQYSGTAVITKIDFNVGFQEINTAKFDFFASTAWTQTNQP